MATEYKLSYTGAEIDEKLGKVSSLEENVNQLLLNEEYVSEQINTKQNTIIGTAGQFVVIGDDGNVTTRDVVIAEEATY